MACVFHIAQSMPHVFSCAYAVCNVHMCYIYTNVCMLSEFATENSRIYRMSKYLFYGSRLSFFISIHSFVPSIVIY